MVRQSSRTLPRGLAYLVAHGHAADGSHAENTEPTQHLVNPPHHMPTRLDVVDSWVRLRAQQGNPLTSGTQPAGPPAIDPEQMARPAPVARHAEGNDR
ncbi:MAG TPA: hypothetical protein VFM01_07590 [Nakamurella sp.]|jgi:hypothetical protein|nr:hypothetical protein [Nakamurella sp.]